MVKVFNILRGFTLIEILMVVAIVFLVAAANFKLQGYLLIDTDLYNNSREIAEILRLAQTRSMTRYQDSQWGVYFYDNLSGNDQFIFFKGNDYISRDPGFDLITTFPSTLSFTTISFNGGGNQIVFNKLNGSTNNYGSLVITTAKNSTATVSINSNGTIDIN